MFPHFHRSARPDLIALLRTVAKGDAFPSLSLLNDREVRWIIETGIGPLFWFVSPEDSKTSSPPREFRAADLTSRLISQIQLETLSEVLLKCKDLIPPITLLKGCSTGSELYPEPHLRVMGDLDLLVDRKDQPQVESVLIQMGFRQQSTRDHEYYATHHHSMPFYHPGKNVWVEVHRGLFPPKSALARLTMFSPQNITAELRASWLNGIPVMRLSTELQIVYTASHWAFELKRRGGLFPFLDIIYLLRKAQLKIRWEAILKWVEDSVAATHLYLVLSYLNKNKIIDLDEGILEDLFVRQKSLGTLNLKIAHYLIRRYIVAGKTPISAWRLAAFWQNLLLDGRAAHNLISASKSILPSFGLRGSA